MILDRGHRKWLWFTVVTLLGSTVLYVLYVTNTPGGPRGGSGPGLAFGIAGTAFIYFAALLGLRKKIPHVRIGRSATWMKGHLWLGALSFPLILFHGGFAWGGPLTSVLMTLFVIVFVTGIYGLALQHILPRMMMRSLKSETVYEQIDHVCEQLLNEATQLIEGSTGSQKAAVPKAKREGRIQGRVVESRAAVDVKEDEGPDRAPLKRLLEEHLQDYFRPKPDRRAALVEPQTRATLFEGLRTALAPELHGVTRDLQALCEQRAELEVQRRMHHWLHGWLFVHVPLSYAMVFLTAVHAVAALYY